MKKGAVFLIIILACISFASAGLEPLAITGHVYDKVTSKSVNMPNVWITCGGSTSKAFIKSSPGSQDLDENAFNWFQCSGSDRLITIRAEHPDDATCFGQVDVAVNSGMNINQDVYICCYPIKASNLNPSGDVHVIGPTKMEFKWIAGSKGSGGNRGEAEYSNWEVWNGPSGKIEKAVSPITREINSPPTWSVTTINGVYGDSSKQCSYTSYSVTGQQNKKCPVPFDLTGFYQEGYVYTSWNSYDIDDEGDACYDIWRGKSMKQGQGLNNAQWDIEMQFPTGNTDKTQIIPAELVTYWEVKSCNEPGDCSEPSIMITPSCNSISSDCPEVKQQGSKGLFNKNDCLKEEGENIEILKSLSNFPWGLGLLIAVSLGLLYLFWKYIKRKEERERKNPAGHGGRCNIKNPSKNEK